MAVSGTPYLKIAFSGDANAYSGTYDDVTADVEEVVDSFIGLADWKDRMARVGTMLFTLRNDWFNQHDTFGLYTPSNAASPLYGLLEPMTEMVLGVSYGGTDYDLFTGYVESFDPDLQRNLCRVTCVDDMEMYARNTPRMSIATDIRSDVLASDIIQATGLARAYRGFWIMGRSVLGTDTVLASGDEALSVAYEGAITFDVAGHTWRAGQTSAYEMLRDVAWGEAGHIWMGRDAQMVFKDRFWDTRSHTADASLETGVIGIEPIYGAQEIYSRIEVNVTPRKIGSSSVVIGELQTAHRVWAGDTDYEIEIHFRDPNGGSSVVAESASVTDSAANSAADGSGVDLTGALTVESIVTHGSSATVTVSATQSLYVTQIELSGVPSYIYDTETIVVEDEDSKYNYSPNTWRISAPLNESVSQARTMAEKMLSLLKDPRLRLAGIELTNVSAAVYQTMLDLTLGSLVDITSTPLGLSNAQYRIISESHRMAGTEHRVRFGLMPHDTTEYWTIGSSALGTGTKIAW